MTLPSITRLSVTRFSMASASLLALMVATPALAQDSNVNDDEVIATGEIQRSFEQSLKVKRNTTVVSDALFGGEIGDLPDLSIAESLERITGVTSDRFKGGASEISVRGLGAFLGSSVINGREITSGSDGRDVNFGQFPSELIGGTQVFKTQQADFVEGGVSGIIELQTLRPLDYGKRRIQAQGLFGIAENEQRVVDGQDFNSRITASYTDQFETSAGDIGIAIGGQMRRDTAPEDIFFTSSSYRPCSTVDGEPRSNGSNSSNNCRFSEGDGSYSGPSVPYFISNQYGYRAMETQSDRDAIMANVQWQPNDSWDVNFDAQYSERFDEEVRHNLVIADGRRDIVPIDIAPSGALLSWSGETRLENQSAYRTRAEDYLGLGLNVEWNNGPLSVTGDVGYSKTERRQDELDMRIRTNPRIRFIADQRGADVLNFEVTQGAFDLMDHDAYSNGARARRRLENIDDEVLAFRLDTDYALEGPFLTSLKVGGRYAERNRINDDGIDQQSGRDFDLVSGGYGSDAVVATRRDIFPIEDLFDGANTDMVGLSWATWNPEDLFVALTGGRDTGLPTGSTLSFDDANIDETTSAVYGMAEFETNWLGLPAYGNFGVRAVHTKIDSLGISSAIETSPGDIDGFTRLNVVGDVATNVETNDFWNILPSANLVFEVQEDMLVRFAAYSAIARPDPGDMSAGLRINTDSDGFADIGEGITANGNPALTPLKSLNFDVSYEWYKSDDTAFSAAFYYKQLQTGFENVFEDTTVDVNGSPRTVEIIRTGVTNEKSDLLGFEVSLNHKFSYLPSLLSGFGFQAGYNHAASNFETPDPTATDSANPLANFTQPANISGYSKHTGNITGYWENDDLSIRLAYKARSPYYKPFRGSSLRFTNAQQFLDFSASYDLTDNIQLRAQALNLTNEPNLFFRPTRDNLAQADYSGRRYFLGLRARF